MGTMIASAPELGELFGWMKTVMTELGVWSWFSLAVQAIIIVSVSMQLVRMLRSGG